jgi:hypothetical protein
MEILLELWRQSGWSSLTPGNIGMFAIAGVLIYLAVTRGYEPLLLIPIAFGALLANLPLGNMSSYGDGLMALIYDAGIRTELLPPLIFLGVGVLTDFRPLLARPLTFLLGAAAQVGIFMAALGAFYLLGFTAQEAASIGIIGGADGPTSIFITIQLAPHLLGAVAVAAYSYMSLVPIMQPPILRLLTTKAERNHRHAAGARRLPHHRHPVPHRDGAGGVAGGAHGGAAAGHAHVRQPAAGVGRHGPAEEDGGRADDRHRDHPAGAGRGRDHGRRELPDVAHAHDHGAGRGGVRVQHRRRHPAGQAAERVPGRRSQDQPVHRRRRRIGGAHVSAGGAAVRVGETKGRVNPLMPAMGPNVAGVIGSAVTAGVFLALLR